MSWPSQVTTSNLFRQSYVSGFLDVSGPTILRSDGGLNLASNMAMNGVICQSINDAIYGNVVNIGTTTFDYFITGRLYVTNDVSFGSRLFVLKDASLASRLFVFSDVSFNGNTYVGNNSIFQGDVSMNSRLFINGDVSMNSRLFVTSDVSLNSRLFVANDASFTGNLYVGNNSIIQGDVSMNNRLFINGDVSMNSRLFVFGDFYVNKNLGVGKPTPQYNLDISGITQVSTGTASTTYFNVNSAIISPNNIAATANSWITYTPVGQVTWTASTSSSGAGHSPYQLFDTNITTSGRWAPLANYYGTAAAQLYAGSATTPNVQNGIGSIAGDWIQIQSSTPLILNSFSFANYEPGASTQEMPRIFYICGSNDNSNWFPIVYGSFNSAYLPNFIISYSYYYNVPATTGTSSQGNLTLITYGNQNTSYSYFRLSVTNVMGALAGGGTTNTGWLSLGEWFTNYRVPAQPAIQSGPSKTVLYMDASNINQLDLSGGLGFINNSNSITVSPNSLAAFPGGWVNNNITWIASGSSYLSASTYARYPAFVFKAPTIEVGWEAGTSYATVSPFNYTAAIYSSTILNGVGATGGEWIQIQANIPLVLNRFNLTTNRYSGWGSQFPKQFFICGSYDGSANWYPLIQSNFTSTPISPNMVNTTQGTTNTFSIPSGTGNGVTGAMSYTTYGNSFNSYNHFRIVVTNVIGTNYSGTNNTGNVGFFWCPIFTVPSSSVSLSIDNALPNQVNLGGTLNVTNQLNVANQLNVGTTINTGGYALFGLSTITYTGGVGGTGANTNDMVWSANSSNGAYYSFQNRIFLNGIANPNGTTTSLANSVITLQDPGAYMIMAKFNFDGGTTSPSSQICYLQSYFWNINASTPVWVNCGNAEHSTAWNGSTELYFQTVIQATNANFNIKFQCGSTTVTWSSDLNWSKLMIYKIG